MKPISPETIALLKTRQFYRADLYTISFAANGANPGPLRYTSADQDLTVNGLLYSSGGQTGPYFDRKDNKAKIHQKVGVEVDTLVFDVIPAAALLFGDSFLDAVRIGVFDGAIITIERVYMPTFGDTRRGTVFMFKGRVADVSAGRSIATFTLNSYLELLNLPFPRNTFQAGCVNNLGDTSCGVNLASFNTTGTVTTGSTQGVIKATLAGGPFIAGAFDRGKIVWSSGANNGLTASTHQATYGTPATITLLGEMPTTPSNGDTFTLYFGCDKTPGLPFTTTANVGSGSSVLTGVGSISGIIPGMNVTGSGMAAGTTVVGFIGINVQLSLPATGAFTGASLTFQSNNGCSKFSNTGRFRGFPRVPQPVTAV